MILGIQKRQWFALLLALSMPLLLNAAGIWHDVGRRDLLQMLRGMYSYIPYVNNSLDLDHNPFPEIFQNLLPTTLFLGFLAWLMIFISNRVFFQKQSWLAKLFEILLMSLFVADTFANVGGFFMPFAWLPVFFNTLGVPVSLFVSTWSWLVVPLTTVILFIALLLSGIKKSDAPILPS
jgi:hypothetical protein